MPRTWSLRLLIPVGVMAVFTGITALSALNSLRLQEVELAASIRERAQYEAARIARHAERFFYVDPQALDEDISQLATDPDLEVAALIWPDGHIRAASDYAWKRQPAAAVLPPEIRQRLDEARQTRQALTIEDGTRRRLIILMSYATPAQAQQLRSLERGVVYLVYDYAPHRARAFAKLVDERLPELAILLLGAIGLLFVLSNQITHPLRRLSQASQALADGEMQPLPDSRAREIHELNTAFNRMSAHIQSQVDELANQAGYTQTILDNVLDGIIALDTRGRILSINQAGERIFGYAPGELVGQSVNRLMPEPQRSEHDGYLARYLQTGEARIIGAGREVTACRRGGLAFPMELSVSEIQHRNQTIFIGVVRDLSEQKRMEQMKREFVSTVSHELRTPLTSIGGSLRLINGGALGPLPEAVGALLDVAQRNTDRLTLLINDLLDMEKIEAGKLDFSFEVLPLMALVEDAISSHHAYAEQHQVRFVITAREDAAQIRVDPQRFTQILANYLSNAAKFSPPGSQVDIEVTRTAAGVRIAVRDRGPGIAEAFRARVFQRFSQADASDSRAKGGTGLGLAITRELAERMAGQVGFESAPGNGATFYVEFPLAQG